MQSSLKETKEQSSVEFITIGATFHLQGHFRWPLARPRHSWAFMLDFSIELIIEQYIRFRDFRGEMERKNIQMLTSGVATQFQNLCWCPKV